MVFPLFLEFRSIRHLPEKTGCRNGREPLPILSANTEMNRVRTGVATSLLK